EAAGDDIAQIVIGDVLEHPRFGRCTVERIEGEQEFAAVRLEAGRLVRLALGVLRLQLLRGGNGRPLLPGRVVRWDGFSRARSGPPPAVTTDPRCRAGTSPSATKAAP